MPPTSQKSNQKRSSSNNNNNDNDNSSNNNNNKNNNIHYNSDSNNSSSNDINNTNRNTAREVNGIVYLEQVLARLRHEVPFFAWHSVILELGSIEAQQRARCWLRGVRRDVCEQVPAPLSTSKLVRLPLDAYLVDGLPSKDPLT